MLRDVCSEAPACACCVVLQGASEQRIARLCRSVVTPRS